jgi:hypothetical protein
MQMSDKPLKYNLNDVDTILSSELNYVIPDDSIKLLNFLSQQIGSSLFIKDNVFHKKERIKERNNERNKDESDDIASHGYKLENKKRKGNKNKEITNEDWDTIRSFQATKIEHKTGLNANLEKIKLILSKLTMDRSNLIKTKEQLINEINEIMESNTDTDVTNKIGNTIFDIAINQKMFSKIYAELYTELIITFDWLKPVITQQLFEYFKLFENMQYYDPDADYDKFCDMNEKNDKRKSATQLFLNFSLSGVINKTAIYDILIKLSRMMYDLINENNRKFEVDEIIENIAILFKKEIIVVEKDTNYDKEHNMINGLFVSELIKTFAKCKSKDYKSLSTKAIFKCMDLIEM